jgi:hypothetical protein
MPTPSAAIIHLLWQFAGIFTAPTFLLGVVLLYGAILCPGRRTVSAALRVMGLADERHFTNYHRVLNRARWSMWLASKVLLALLVAHFVPAGLPVVLLIDETLERRKGAKIKYKGWFRDAVRSSATYVNKSLGIRWLVVALLVRVPWSQRLWALPFLAVPVLSPKTSARLKKRHRTVIEWAGIVIDRIRRWQPDRPIALVGDGTYAAHPLIARCQRMGRPVTLVSRLRLDAALYDAPGPQPKGKRGPKPKKGARQPSLQAHLHDPSSAWATITLPWYGGPSSAARTTPSSRAPSCARTPPSAHPNFSLGLWRAGTLRSPSRKCAPSWASRPNASGRTAPLSARPPPS